MQIKNHFRKSPLYMIFFLLFLQQSNYSQIVVVTPGTADFTQRFNLALSDINSFNDPVVLSEVAFLKVEAPVRIRYAVNESGYKYPCENALSIVLPEGKWELHVLTYGNTIPYNYFERVVLDGTALPYENKSAAVLNRTFSTAKDTVIHFVAQRGVKQKLHSSFTGKYMFQTLNNRPVQSSKLDNQFIRICPIGFHGREMLTLEDSLVVAVWDSTWLAHSYIQKDKRRVAGVLCYTIGAIPAGIIMRKRARIFEAAFAQKKQERIAEVNNRIESLRKKMN